MSTESGGGAPRGPEGPVDPGNSEPGPPPHPEPGESPPREADPPEPDEVPGGIFPSWRSLYLTLLVYTGVAIVVLYVLGRLMNAGAS